MNLTNIEFLREGSFLFITINRPESLNAINKQMLVEINYVLGLTEHDDSIRAILITGAGPKAFIAGADIKEFLNYNIEQAADLSVNGKELVFKRLSQYKKPIIALINGYALGGGLELAMACHLRIASSNAKLGLPEVSLGLIPGYGGTQLLSQLVGKGKAMEMILTGDVVDAETAMQIGLVNQVCDQEELLEKGIVMAHSVIKNSPNAIKKAIKAINHSFDASVNGDLEESNLFGECFQHKDFVEGTIAFLEKRKPKF